MVMNCTQGEKSSLTNITYLHRYCQDGVEVLEIPGVDEIFSTVGTYSHMTGIPLDTLKKRYKRGGHGQAVMTKYGHLFADSVDTKFTINTKGGIQEVNLISEDIFLDWLEKDSPKILRAFAKGGFRTVMLKKVGIDRESLKYEPPQETQSAFPIYWTEKSFHQALVDSQYQKKSDPLPTLAVQWIQRQQENFFEEIPPKVLTSKIERS